MSFKISLLGFLLITTFLASAADVFAENYPADGRYRAQVKTEEGTYTVPVDVRDGAVTAIRWPNGKKTKIRGTDLDRGETVGYNFYGDQYKISIDDKKFDDNSRSSAKDYE